MAATTSFLSLLSYFSVLFAPLPPMPVSGQIVTYGGAALAQYARSVAPSEVPGEDSVAVLRLESGTAGQTRAFALFCTREGRYVAEGACIGEIASGEDYTALRIDRGVVGLWKVKSAYFHDGQAYVEGAFVGEAPDGLDDERAPSLVLVKSPAASPVVSVAWATPEAERVTDILADARKPLRISPKLADGLGVVQHFTAPMISGRPDALIASVSNAPTAPLDEAPRPSLSLVFGRIEGGRDDGSDWLELAASQAITKEHDVRQFERYEILAVLDLDADGRSELLVRGRSSLGDRYRLYTTDQRDRLRQASGWAGVAQPSSAPRR